MYSGVSQLLSFVEREARKQAMIIVGSIDFILVGQGVVAVGVPEGVV